MTNSRTREYYTEEKMAEMVAFANEYARVPKVGHRITGIDIQETICRHPFVAFVQDNGEVIMREWFR